MAEYNLFIKFATELVVNGSITLPTILLKGYKKIGLTETELLLLIHLWRFQQEDDNSYPSLKELSSLMTLAGEEIQNALASLIEKRVLSIERLYDQRQNRWVDQFSFAGLFDKLMEIWAMFKAQELEANEEAKQLSRKVTQDLFQAFEEEFGRLLSPFESNKILEWCYEDNHTPDLILEALRKASIRGIKNLKYIDTILADWRDNQVTSLEQIEKYEKQFQNKQRKKESTGSRYTRKDQEIKQKIDKYKDVYMS